MAPLQTFVDRDAFARFAGIEIGVNAFKDLEFSTSKSVPITPLKIQAYSPTVRVQMMDQVAMIQKTGQMAVVKRWLRVGATEIYLCL